MYFLDIKGLIQHLKAEANTEYESFQYLVGVMICALFNVEAVLGRTELKPSATSVVGGILVVTLGGFIGYKILQSYYRSNGGDQGKFFLDRLISISWVISCRIALVLIPVLILEHVFFTLVGSGDPSVGLVALGVFVVAAIVGCTYYSISRTNRALREVSGFQPQVTPEWREYMSGPQPQ